MKIIRYAVVCFIGLLINFPVFADTYDTTKPNLIYCPNKVECNGTCHFDDDKQQYFVSMNGSGNNAGVVPGVYNFMGAYSDSQIYLADRYPHTAVVGRARCQYTKSGGIGFMLSYKREANLEVYKNESSKWDDYISSSHCLTTDPLLCPLLIKPELVLYMQIGIYPSIRFLSVKTTANGIPIKNSIQLPSYPQRYLSINYNEAFIACQGMKQCPINIYYSDNDNGNNHPYYFTAGSVIIDMTNTDMHILEINTGQVNGGNGQYLLKKMGSFNAIQFVA
jgi:hypothetical protein